ncbi:MAG: glutamate synthase-related protein, partial [Thermodesulfobacteriota bacterium]|nr:glutamate synthase-related protein [Thermodesulfobacteriota bacterium]
DSGKWPIPHKRDQGRDIEEYLPHIAFYLNPDAPTLPREVLGKTRLVEIPDSNSVLEGIKELKDLYPEIIVLVRVNLDSNGVQRAIELAKAGVETIHVVADPNGNEIGAAHPRFIKDMIREIHTAIIKDGKRDEVTIIAGGGIALAEHMAKAVICGADLVSTYLPFMIALECRLCDSCRPGFPCPAQLGSIDFKYGVGRMRNLVAAWHLQLIEVMGAMGMREARRLRGDVGRAMFFEDLEEEIFGALFGSRKKA